MKIEGDRKKRGKKKGGERGEMGKEEYTKTNMQMDEKERGTDKQKLRSNPQISALRASGSLLMHPCDIRSTQLPVDRYGVMAVR